MDNCTVFPDKKIKEILHAREAGIALLKANLKQDAGV
jgi:hypothetical protein